MDFRSFVLGLIICFLLSFLLGLERQFRRRLLGLRTMILVSVGSYLFVSFSFLLGDYQTDVTRIAAQVVAGIGFLGAGGIIKDSKHSKVKGLTTAATLWCDASIGVLCAGGFVKEAIAGSLVVLFANIILRYVNSFVNNKVEEMSILETFAIVFNSSIDKIDDVRENVISFINKSDYIDVDSYEVDKGKMTMNVVLKKADMIRFDRFINKIVTDYNISNYEIKKISESKLEDTEEM